ncbi:MAG: alpha/beta hydrolase-fold protein, partial [Phycisphaerae bacterium]
RCSTMRTEGNRIGAWRTVIWAVLLAMARPAAAEPPAPVLLRRYSHWGYWYYHFRHGTDETIKARGVRQQYYDFLVRLPLLRPSVAAMSRPAPLVVLLHARGSDFRQHERRWPDHVVLTPDDNTQGVGHSGWFGYHERLPGPPTRQSRVVPYTQRRVLYTVRFVVERFKIDRNRIWLAGGSMGGTGALLLALRYPEWFAGCRAWQPLVDLEACPELLPQIERLLGPRQWNLAVAGTRIGVWDYLKLARWLRQSPPYAGWIQIEHGLADRRVRFEQYLQSGPGGQGSLLDLLQNGTIGGPFVWDQRTHERSDPLGQWFPPYEPLARGDVALDKPMVIFSHLSCGALALGGRLGQWHTGGDPRKDARGLVNGFLRWDGQGLIDRPDRLAISIWLTDSSVPAWRLPIDRLRCDIVIRRPHRFPLPVGGTVRCRIAPAGRLRWIKVTEAGQITIRDVLVRRGRERATRVLLDYEGEQPIVAVYSPTHPTRQPRQTRELQVQWQVINARANREPSEFDCQLIRIRDGCVVREVQTCDKAAVFAEVEAGAYYIAVRARHGDGWGPRTCRWVSVE